MKNLIIALMVFAVTLGVSCKKDNAQPGNDHQHEKEITLKVQKGVSVVDPNHPPENGGGQGTFPHNTGVCNCGKYLSCHPYFYYYITYDSDGFGYRHEGIVGSKTSFPVDSWFGPRD
jgi:hypothetical protein